ncbi:hypothetical protein FHG87_020209 [Trinorchestia longiramus]|nr:hypothetical protein FHG87_020209 [Trinorchestia longiramus]
MMDLTFQVHDHNAKTQLKCILNYTRANFELMEKELDNFNDKVLMRNKNAHTCLMLKGATTLKTQGHQITNYKMISGRA